MKVLFIMGAMEVGGMQRALSIITKELLDLGMTIDVLSFKKSKNKIEFNSGIKLIISENKSKYFIQLKRLRATVQKIKEEKPDIVIGFGITSSILACAARLFTKFKLVICERNDPGKYHMMWKFSRWILYHNINGAVFQTEDAQNYFPRRIIKKSIIIENPIDISELPEPLIHKEKIIINTSRFVTSKNQEMLIEAFSRIHPSYPEYQLHLYGYGRKQEIIEELINTLDMHQSVKIFPPQQNIYEILNRAEIFVLSSSKEGFPNSLVEAMALGVTSIATDCRIGGPRAVIQTGINGILIEVDNTDQLAGELERLLNDKELREKISVESVKIRKRLDSKRISKVWQSYLESIFES